MQPRHPLKGERGEAFFDRKNEQRETSEVKLFSTEKTNSEGLKENKETFIQVKKKTYNKNSNYC